MTTEIKGVLDLHEEWTKEQLEEFKRAWKESLKSMGSIIKDPKRVAAGKKAKRKGNANENKLAKQFQAWWGHGEWARTPSSGGWATKSVREDFRTCGDIITTAEDFPFCVEAKNQGKKEDWCLDQLILNDKPIVMEWWKQTVEETPDGLFPLLVFKRSHIKPMAMFEHKILPFWGVDVHKIFLYSIPKTETFLVIMPLEEFFKIPPSEFEKADLDETR